MQVSDAQIFILTPSLVVEFTVTALIARLLYNKYRSGLIHVPGPSFADFKDFDRLDVARRYHTKRWHIRLHQQHGDFVRIGPRAVLCSSNRAAERIYAVNAGFKLVNQRVLI